MNLRRVIALTGSAALAVALVGCAPAAGDDSVVQVVASTNVYGSLAEQIGGDRVEVTSIITSATQDPHSYEATARDQLAVQRAGLVIENGGGYDAFIDTLLEGVDTDPEVLTAVEFSHDWPDNDGHDEEAADEVEEHADDSADDADHDDHADDEGDDGHDHAEHGHVEGFNEHVWYDVHTMTHVVEGIAHELAELDPAGATEYEASAAALIAELEGIEGEIAAVKAAHEGDGVFLTEPVPGYLAAAAGLVDVAPDGFAAAVEEGRDVAPATLLAALGVVESGTARAVLSNAQTGGAETTRVEDAATDAGIPVVPFAELLTPDSTYAEWMNDNVARLAAALAT